VVISHVPSGHLNLDADWVAEETDGFADVVVIANGTSTYDLEGALPAGWRVFGNAARAYRADGQGPTQYVRPVNAGELRPKAAELVGLVQGLPLPDGMRKQVMTGPLPAVPAPA
ncbi:hypothetical protein HER39_15825, partial [Arthrobacter deserti]|nr:hypothetical protein [Arthrobacter deserti]